MEYIIQNHIQRYRKIVDTTNNVYFTMVIEDKEHFIMLQYFQKYNQFNNFIQTYIQSYIPIVQ